MKETFNRILRALLLWLCIVLIWLLLERHSQKEIPENSLNPRDYFLDHVRATLPVADHFDFPLHPPDGEGSYLQGAFREKGSLGEWWVLEKKNPSGAESVYSLGDGLVTLADDFKSSWGNVVMVAHRLDDGYPDSAEILYANLVSLDVKKGDMVKRGQKIGTIESSDDKDASRLYLEVRDEVGLGLGPGESTEEVGWTKPSDFINSHRQQ